MNFKERNILAKQGIAVHNLLPEIGHERMVHQILQGLTSPEPEISSIFFYDAIGSKLFEEITMLPEYYLTRTEKELIKQASMKLGNQLKGLQIIELGSGDCSKISLLLQDVPKYNLETLSYKPVDVSFSAIENAAQRLLYLFPGLTVEGVIADFITQIDQIPMGEMDTLYCFFGSTLGNLSCRECDDFFIALGEVMNVHDQFLLGVDMVKDKGILEIAYNDSKNITAMFNRNILNVVNSILDADFNSKAYDHIAFYNEDCQRIEMHLKAMADQVISSPHLPEELTLCRGDTIHTENSHKFTRSRVGALAERAGLIPEDVFTDVNGWFSLYHFKKGR